MPSHEPRAAPPPLVLRPSDFDEAAVFVGRIFESANWLSLFKHWWDNNPSWSESVPRGWIYRGEGGGVVGFMANIPFRYAIDDRSALACAASSLAVDASCRGQGLAKGIGRAYLAQEGADLLIGTGSSHEAWRLWLALGMRELEHDWTRANYLIPADLPAFVRRSFPRVPAVRLASPLVQKVGGRVLSSLEWLRGTRDLSIDEIVSFGALDPQQLAACIPNRGIQRTRSVETLDWFYFGSEELRRTRTVLVARREGSLVGFMGIKYEEAGASYILECCTGGRVDVARALLFRACAIARAEGRPYVSARASSPTMARALPRWSLASRRRPFPYCYLLPGRVHSDWETGPADGDLGIT